MKTSSKELERALKIKEKISSERPEFNRSEHTRFPRLGDKWRSSKGIRSKMRIKKRSRAAIVENGYRGPAIARGLRADGRTEIMVYRATDLTAINPESQVARISGEVGKRKRIDILAKAEELNILILNKRLNERKAPMAEAKEEEQEEKEVAEVEPEEEPEEEIEGQPKEESPEQAAEEKAEKPKREPKRKKAPKEEPTEEEPEEEPAEPQEEQEEEPANEEETEE